MIRRIRILRASAPAPVLALAALWLAAACLAAACGGGGDVRIVALTRTPTPEAAVTGEAAPAPGPAAPAPRPSADLPEAPDNPLAGGPLVAGYLAGGGADVAGCLPELAAAWRLADVRGERCLFADIDGDGASELAYALAVAAPGGERPGDVWFFEDAAEGFRLRTSARVLANDVLEDVAIEAVADLTGDRFPDLVISARVCGGGACAGRLLVASGHRGTIEDLAPPGLALSALDSVRAEDATGDGLADVVLRERAAAEPGAGPPRGRGIVLNWGGLKFFERYEPDPPRYLFHAVADADAAFAAGAYAEARSRYEAAVSDTALVDWRVETGTGSGRAELAPYALLRAGLAAQREGDEAGALALFARAADGYAASLHGQAAAIFREAAETGVSPAEACTAAVGYLRVQQTRYAAIWNYGFANPEHSVGDLCR